jgi:nitrogen fixation/metabolism regulation signal transduction histidine kinase
MARKTTIKQSEDLFESVLNTVSDAVIVIDNDLRVGFQNKTITQIYGSRIGENCFKAFRGRKEP